jgi:hypothetical protein
VLQAIVDASLDIYPTSFSNVGLVGLAAFLSTRLRDDDWVSLV